jgi:DNA polymerase elongation subunit (family B)
LECHAINHNIYQKGGTYKTETRTYCFATHVQGVLPRLLTRLLDARKSVKRAMAQCEDPQQKAILNGRQNGIKVACNSVYGFCGVSEKKGLLPCKPVAAVTTLKGRAFIDAAKNFVESNYRGSKVIYGDTDSIMIFWGEGTEVKDAATKGKEAALAITQLLRSGQIADIGGAGALAFSNSLLESGDKNSFSNKLIAEACSAVSLAYEKTYRPYLLLRKKNYAGLKYTENAKGEFYTEIDMKGIDAIRRDRPKLLRDTSSEVLDILLKQRSAEKALEKLRLALHSIASGETPHEDFILSKSLKSTYVSNNLPHVTAWKRMMDRGDEGLPPIGARMPFIVVADKNGLCGKKSKVKLYERTEHPSYVRSKQLIIDRSYYIESLKNPLSKLLQYVVPEATLKDIFKSCIETADFKSSKFMNLWNIEGQMNPINNTMKGKRPIVSLNNTSKKRKANESESQNSKQMRMGSGLKSFL